MADTFVVDQNEMTEDIAIKEKFQEDKPKVDKDEETSNASLGVNEVTSSGDQNNDSTSGADGDPGNAETVEDTSSSEQKESSKSTSLPICKQCNFVFITQTVLEKHEVQQWIVNLNSSLLRQENFPSVVFSRRRKIIKWL